MRKLIAFAFVLFSLGASAQSLQYSRTYGYQYQRLLLDSAAGIPSDTFPVPVNYKDKVWIAGKVGTSAFYIWNTTSQKWELAGGGTGVSSFSSGNLSPLFTTSVSNPTTTPAQSFALTNAGANTYFGNATGSTGAPSYTSAGSLTKTDDTNVTLTFSGNPTTSLLRSVGITAGWTGTLADSRIASAATWNAKLANITGLITPGSNVSITGLGTFGSPYSISSSGGGSAGPSDTIYLLMTGQSNMGGYNLGNVDTASNAKVFGWDVPNQVWRKMVRGQFPMGTYNPTTHWGAAGFNVANDTGTSVAFYFAKRLQEETGKYVKVMMLAWGGNSIVNWLPSGGSANWNTIVSQTTAAAIPRYNYVGWLQGESDGSMVDTTYKRKLDSVVARMDATTWMSKSTPFFIYTNARTFNPSGENHINQVLKAIASGMYDPRYTLVDMSDEPGIGDNDHFNALAHYNGGNKTMQALRNRQLTNNRFRITQSGERSLIVSEVPRVGLGLIVTDSTTRLNYSFDGAAFKEMAGSSGISAFTDGSGFDGTITGGTTLSLTTQLTQGSIPFIGASGILTQDQAKLYWNATNGQLGVGTNSFANSVFKFTLGTTSGDNRLSINGNNAFGLYLNNGASGTAVLGSSVVGDAVFNTSGGIQMGRVRNGGGMIIGPKATAVQYLDIGDAGSVAGTFSVGGSTSGTISFLPQAAAGTYNWNWPIIAGNAGEVLTSQGGGSTAMTWTTPLTNPMTTIGDIIQGTTAGAPARLASVATGNALISGGVGTGSSWGKIGLTTHVSGTLPVGNGGLGVATTPTNGTIPIGNGTNYVNASITGTANRITVTPGSGTITLSGPQDLATTSTPQFARMGIGAAATAPYGIYINGTDIIPFAINGTSAPGVGATAVGADIAPTFTENSSGTHAEISSMRITAPSVTNAAAAVTNSYTLHVGDNPITTGATNLALQVDGSSRFVKGISYGSTATITDGATVTFDCASYSIAKVTLGGNRTLAISNAVAGQSFTLELIQDGTGSRTITLPGTCKVANGGAGAVTLTATAAAVDILTFWYDGTSYFVNIGKNYN